MIALVGSHTFKSLVKARKAQGFGVVKHSVDKVEKIADRTLRFTISTGAIDRDMDCINVRGWQLQNYMRNPVVLWSHRADELPIGKVADIGCDDHRLHAAIQFLPSGGYGQAGDLAEVVYRMAQDGYLAATSVGFRPIKYDFSQDPDRGGESWFGGIDYDEQELVELSMVSVPSNPDALIENPMQTTAIPIEPGAADRDSADVLVPAPVQLISYEAEARKRRQRLVEVLRASTEPALR